ncbi:hypothetical protein C5167_013878 [Papaver somniferum]|uniref:Uncharacterized protein n=1 Tax=Papaver somniferum TaxID=3469 RepID=A0A4Y7J5V4_PAPSO|nr:hypothetical protein C5167_013878 [Papaver somniferum]
MPLLTSFYWRKKIKNVVKVVSAVRGLLCRTQAVGSLLCIQVIVKMQPLVRVRRALAMEGCYKLGIKTKTMGLLVRWTTVLSSKYTHAQKTEVRSDNKEPGERAETSFSNWEVKFQMKILEMIT